MPVFAFYSPTVKPISDNSLRSYPQSQHSLCKCPSRAALTLFAIPSHFAAIQKLLRVCDLRHTPLFLPAVYCLGDRSASSAFFPPSLLLTFSTSRSPAIFALLRPKAQVLAHEQPFSSRTRRAGCLAAHHQSLVDRLHGDALHVHGGAGHQHRQRRSSAHRRQPLRRH